MKTISYIQLLGLIVLVSLSGCRKLADVNVDPNQPSEVTTPLLLSAAEANYAYTQGGDISRYVAVWMQQLKGADRQFVAVDNYQVTEVDMDNAWRFGLYGGAMQDFYLLTKQANAEGNPYYEGIGKTLMAYALLTSTDCFGDVPYSDAFQGAENLLPKYDTQEQIYATINTLLTEARTLFGKPATDNGKVPGTEDLIYSGNIAKWTALTHAIEARAYLHLSKRDNANRQKALDAVSAARTAGFEDAAFPFGSTPTTANPWYQFSSQRSGYISFEGFLADTMAALSDPRVANYTAAMDENPSGPYGASDAPIVLLSDAELDFIEAECKFALGNAADAHTAYLSGVKKALAFNGVSAADEAAYLAQASVDPGSANLSLAHIMFQKYIAMFTQPETWSDWRRTNMPALTPTSGGNVPRRFLYPQSENLYNSANLPQGQTMFTRVWWDVQ